MSEERLRRIEILLETCAKTTVANQAEIKEVRQQISELTTQTNQLTIQMASLSEMFIESVGIMKTMQLDIKIMQSEIKGLQTENKRILDHLFGDNQQN
ncbi:hypothetical protein [Geminocystis sp. GBBB08]|uniref:hypothetical protein n=1 Tax=Geminocystis sp. GBBB08 TaxID=2604140 RepID=UPI0027E2C12D|nr:hypothetical protein [Geminocystis sp. GBBB08]MBL1208828.1 hypothetical protein [Geminocystis sp. GBBB08]